MLPSNVFVTAGQASTPCLLVITHTMQLYYADQCVYCDASGSPQNFYLECEAFRHLATAKQTLELLLAKQKLHQQPSSLHPMSHR